MVLTLNDNSNTGPADFAQTILVFLLSSTIFTHEYF